MTPEGSRTVWFHRDYVRFTGGHLKHADYVDHVRRAPGFTPRLTFSSEPAEAPLLRERERLWPMAEGAAPNWAPSAADILFLGGTDWRYLDAVGLDGLPNRPDQHHPARAPRTRGHRTP